MTDPEIRGIKTESDRALALINSQILTVFEEARRLNIAPYDMKHVNGEYVLTPLLTAKANVLLALSNLARL